MSSNRKGFLQKMGLPHHEYWPWWTLVAPVWPLWIANAFRLGKATWFTAVNPGIEDGGFLGESKFRIFEIIPKQYLPKTQFISTQVVLDSALVSQWSYPLIAKPDIGGRGRKIKIIHSFDELRTYHEEVGEDYLIQEIIESPLELGVFYARLPSQTKGQILSIASKAFLSVTGNGTSSIKELMRLDKRASDQITRLGNTINLDRIPKFKEEVLLEPIGNHCKGTQFINENHRINAQMIASMDVLAHQMNGFYYGRFDIRVPSWEDLERGKNISILELNGLTSDPAHIFDSNYRLRDVFRTHFSHIGWAFRIARENLKAGTRTTPLFTLMSKSFNALRNA